MKKSIILKPNTLENLTDFDLDIICGLADLDETF